MDPPKGMGTLMPPVGAVRASLPDSDELLRVDPVTNKKTWSMCERASRAIGVPAPSEHEYEFP